MEPLKSESYVLYMGFQRMSVKNYEKLQQEHKTAACYYYHWRRKVFRLSRIVYPDSKWAYWALFNLPVTLCIGYDLIKETVQYEYETQQLIKIYHKLKLEKYGIR